MKGLQPANLTPKNCNEIVFPIESYEIAAWSPDRLGEGTGKCTQVHIVLRGRGMESPLVLRIKSRDACDALIALLERHRDDVWDEKGNTK